MPINSLRISDFRNLAAVDIQPERCGLNLFCGNNGSGKTSLLEAIHYLGLGRSFRSSSASRLIRHTKQKFSVFAHLTCESERQLSVGVERDLNGATRLKLAEKEAANIMDVAQFLPLRMINSQSHQLFESGPSFRRKYLDWGLFYQSDAFLSCWRHFERILKQRNAILKDRRPKKELDAWSIELIKYGLELDKLRKAYVEALEPLLIKMTEELLGVNQVKIGYQSGWNDKLDYATALSQAYADDCRLGYTSIGPQKADFDVTINDVDVKHFLSRGQQKLLICAMILAQGMLLTLQANQGLIYLVDDLPSELDLSSRQKLISLLSKQKTQIFVTAIESETICSLISAESSVPTRVFHVEHGVVE